MAEAVAMDRVPAALECLDLSGFLARWGGGWDALLDAAGNTNPFLTLDWLRSWWEHFGTPGRERILVQTAGGRPVAAAFLRIETETHLGMPVRSLRFWVNSHSHRAGLLAADPRDFASGLAGHLAADRGWDVARLHGLAADDGIGGALLEALEAAGLQGGVDRRWANHHLPLTGSFADYYRDLSPRSRQKGERLGRRLADTGAWACRRYDGADMATALERYRHIEARSWKADRGEIISRDTRLEGFYQQALERLAAHGNCCAYVLEQGAAPVAAVLALRRPGWICVLKTSFDDAYKQYSPGWLVYRELIRDAFADGLREVDLFGHTRFTAGWSERERRFEDLLVFSRHWRGRAAWLSKRFKTRLREILP